ncbi:CU044_5270 family protein [Kribbella sp. NBC_00889]|uniref:CU044_5270 family protein n=1 Tax=Kribbella sp. NBC_00889 TaxID=2975974 RepID=UPI003863F504|nr:CU044_5270 family protein [Kribbella sp. NBC_00889]
MNELESVRKAFPSADAPSAEATGTARQQLEGLIREEPRPKRWLLAARAGWVGTALTAATAVIAVVALGTPLVRGTGDDAGVAPATINPTPPRLASAGEALLAAAVQQEKDEKLSGRFYRVRSLQIGPPVRVGNPKYTVQGRSIIEGWMPMKPRTESWFGWAGLGYRPVTATDTAKWRAQGSPTSWQLQGGDTVEMHAMAPMVDERSFQDVPQGYYLTGTEPLSAQQIAALPTDPVKLRALLASGADRRSSPAERNYTVFAAAGQLLFETPSPPKLRGAALRVLATLPGTRIRTGVKDPIGRTGTEITIDVKGQPSGSATIMARGRTAYIIDTATGRLLSSSMEGLKVGSTVVLQSGWTDQKPVAPSPVVR